MGCFFLRVRFPFRFLPSSVPIPSHKPPDRLQTAAQGSPEPASAVSPVNAHHREPVITDSSTGTLVESLEGRGASRADTEMSGNPANRFAVCGAAPGPSSHRDIEAECQRHIGLYRPCNHSLRGTSSAMLKRPAGRPGGQPVQQPPRQPATQAASDSKFVHD